MRCSGKIAVITGGARGIGLTLAYGLAKEGAAIALLDVLPEVQSSAEALAANTGVPTIGLHCDVTDPESVNAAFAQVHGELGVPNVLITSAGITSWCDSIDVTPEDWQRVIDINLNGTFFACQAFGRGLLAKDQPGSAILISSMSGQIVNVPQHQASYNVSKAGVTHLAKSLAVEWAKQGIRVNALEPGYTLSDMTRQFMDANPDLQKLWVSMIPAGRMGEPEDLVGAVVLLASDESRYLTGQSIVIDGGYTAI